MGHGGANAMDDDGDIDCYAPRTCYCGARVHDYTYNEYNEDTPHTRYKTTGRHVCIGPTCEYRDGQHSSSPRSCCGTSSCDIYFPIPGPTRLTHPDHEFYGNGDCCIAPIPLTAKIRIVWLTLYDVTIGLKSCLFNPPTCIPYDENLYE